MSDVTSTSATTDPLTLGDVKLHLNISTTHDDAYLSTLVKAATETLEKRLNACFITQTRSLKMQTFNDCRYVFGRDIHLPRSPITGTPTVSYVDSQGTTTTMPTSDYIVRSDERPGILSEAYNATWPATRNVPESVTVTYNAGHGSTQSDVPVKVQHAIKLLCAHWYRNREHVLVGEMSKELEWTLDALLEGESAPNYG